LTPEILNDASFVIAMSTEHRNIFAKRFNRPYVPLFTAACDLPSEPLPDVEDVVIDPYIDPEHLDTSCRHHCRVKTSATPSLRHTRAGSRKRYSGRNYRLVY
jgi:hypothetical protein